MKVTSWLGSCNRIMMLYLPIPWCIPVSLQAAQCCIGISQAIGSAHPPLSPLTATNASQLTAAIRLQPLEEVRARGLTPAKGVRCWGNPSGVTTARRNPTIRALA